MAEGGKEGGWEEMRQEIREGKQCLSDEGKHSSADYLQSTLSIGPEDCCFFVGIVVYPKK